MSRILVCLSLLCLALGSRAQGTSERGLPHASPCPDVYSYGWEPAGGWHGIITILPPARFSEVQLVLRMTVPYYRPEAGVGRVEVKGGTPEIQAISRRAFRGERHKIQFMIIFPPFDDVPRVKEIFFNGKSFCAANQVYADTRSTIELKYTLRSGLNLPLANGNAFSVVSASPSRPGLAGEEVIYVVQGQQGTYVIPGSQLGGMMKPATTVAPPESVVAITTPTTTTPAPTTATPTTTTTTSTTTTTTPASPTTEEVDYWDIFSSPSSEEEPSPTPAGQQPATTRRPRPSTSRRPRPKPKPRPTTSTTPTYEDVDVSAEVTGAEFQVNGLNCGVPKARPNYLVVNGVAAEKGQWPWQAAMFKTSSTGLTFQCGGTLVSKRHVITAAHCVYEKTKQKPVAADTVLVYLGKHSLRSWTEEGQQAKDVDRIVLHPNYGKKHHDFDVAILILSTSAEFSDFVSPVCLWDKSPNLNPVINKPGTVVGWGRDENGDIANELKTAKMPVVSQETCLRSDEFYSVFTSDVTFCAGYRNGTSVCNGDSGGGMFFYLDNPKQHVKTWYTRGVVSISRLQASEQLCDDKSYVVFTDLAKMLPWIRRQLVPPATAS